MTDTIVVCGLGYVGLPLALRATSVGNRVVGYDPNQSRIARLTAGQSYVTDISNDEVADALDSGRFSASADIEACRHFDVAVIAVPTPLCDGSPDMAYVEQCARDLAGLLRPGCTVVLESTTYPGTTRDLLAPLLEAPSGLQAGADFHLGYSPERIDPGNATWTLTTTPKIVSGVDSGSLDAVDRFYRSLGLTTVPVATVEEAELAKLLENTFRTVNIALVNELAIVANGLGIDIWNAVAAAATKPFGFMPFMPGPGVGGHCIPIDPSYLNWKSQQSLGTSSRFIDLAVDINDHMPAYVTTRVTEILNRRGLAVNGAHAVLLGLSYKRNTADVRESPSLAVCDLLHGLGAKVTAVDPLVGESDVPDTAVRAELSEDLLDSADVVIVLSDHDDLDWDLIQACQRPIFDTRHRLQPGDHVEYL